MNTLTGHRGRGTQESLVGEGQDHPQAKAGTMPIPGSPAGQIPEPTIVYAASKDLSSVRVHDMAAATLATEPKAEPPLPLDGSVERGHTGNDAQPTRAVLADPTLALLADVLDDLERTRIANENRLRQLTRTETDADGSDRGFGLPLDHPDVARLAGVVDGITALEHQATLNLARIMRKHPLGPWMKTQRGVGEKQGARLLATIGDPYWNTLHDRPRTVSELWAYCGLHVIRTDHACSDPQLGRVGAEQNGNPGHAHDDVHLPTAGVAARRRKGEKANWSTAAKMRAWNIAGSMLKAGNRETYDKRKAATEGRTHIVPCVRCGPSGHPAQPGSPWSDAHRHADALRIVSKALLKDLWLTARDIHSSQFETDTQGGSAGMDQL